ncbi:MAG: hypothetical protein CNLJKLNK_01145 [Holosporales bacterium]
MQSANDFYWNSYHAFMTHLEEEEICFKKSDIDKLDILEQNNNALLNNYINAYQESAIDKDIVFAHDTIIKKIKSINEILKIDLIIYADLIKDITKQFEKPKVAYGPYLKNTPQAKASLMTKEI